MPSVCVVLWRCRFFIPFLSCKSSSAHEHVSCSCILWTVVPPTPMTASFLASRALRASFPSALPFTPSSCRLADDPSPSGPAAHVALVLCSHPRHSGNSTSIIRTFPCSGRSCCNERDLWWSTSQLWNFFRCSGKCVANSGSVTL